MSTKTLQIEDIFNLEQIGGEFSFSPDGKTLAYVLQRAKATTKNHKQDFLWGNDRADIWLVNLVTLQSTNITNGATEDVGYWSPAWSPDGERLAMLSTKGDNVTLWVWSKTTGNLQQLTQRGINFEDVSDRPYTWISHEEIICTVLPESEKPLGMILETDAPQKAWLGSQAANRGEEVTVSVLRSSVDVDLKKRDLKTTIVINMVNKLLFIYFDCPKASPQ